MIQVAYVGASIFSRTLTLSFTAAVVNDYYRSTVRLLEVRTIRSNRSPPYTPRVTITREKNDRREDNRAPAY